MMLSTPLKKFSSVRKLIPAYIFFITFALTLLFSITAAYLIKIKQVSDAVVSFEQHSGRVIAELKELSNEKKTSFTSKQFNDRTGVDLDTAELVLWTVDGRPVWHSDEDINSQIKNNAPIKEGETNHNLQLIEKFITVMKDYDSDNKSGMLEDKSGYAFILFSIPIHGGTHYGHFSEKITVISGLSLFLYAFGFSLIVTFLLTIAMSSVSYGILTPIEGISSSLEYFRKTNYVELVHYYSENEIGKLVANYNQLLQSVEQKTVGGIHTDNSPIHVDNKSSDDVAAKLQEKMFKRPFHRFQNFEVTLFPRNPDSQFRKFMTASESDQMTQFFFVHYDVNGTESMISKYSLHEQFLALTENGVEPNKIAETLWNNMFANLDLGPGMLYMNWDIENNSLNIFRSGSFEIFLQGAEDTTRVSSGSDYFNSNFGALQRHDININDKVIVVSREALEHLNMPVEEFEIDIIKSVENAANPARQLAVFLAKISSIEKIDEEFTAMLAVIAKKA